MKPRSCPFGSAFDLRLKLEFHGARITSDAGLLAYRELDDALGLTAKAASVLAEGRRGKNIRHRLLGLFRQAVYGRLAGYEDVNDAERLARDPAMRAIVGREGLDRPAASSSQMGRFETDGLATEANLAALTDLSGAWIHRVHRRRPPDGIILDMDSSDSPTWGEQEGSAWNGHFRCTCYHPLFVFNQFGDLERCALRPGNVHSAEGWRDVLEPVIARSVAREAREDRRPDRAPRPLCGVPAGRGGGAARPVRRDPAPDRPLARTARGGSTDQCGPWGGRSRGEHYAPMMDQRHQSSSKRPVDRGPVVPYTRDLPNYTLPLIGARRRGRIPGENQAYPGNVGYVADAR